MIKSAALLMSVAIVLILSLPASGREVRQVVFVSDPWPPFVVGEEGKEARGGIAIDLCREIFSRLGVKLSSQIHPWKRTMGYLETGEADLTFPLIQNEQRSAAIAFTDVVMIDRNQLWFLTQRDGGPIEWKTITDLKPFIIGVVSGYTHGELFEGAIKEGMVRTEPCISYEQGIRKLLRSRMDLLLGNETVVSSLIRSHPEWKGKLTCTSRFVSRLAYRIGISRKSPAMVLIPEINRLIQEMTSDGTINRILQK